MNTWKVLLYVVLASLFVLAITINPWIGTLAQAVSQREAQTGAGVSIPYQGRLMHEEGDPHADGKFDFRFSLYSEQAGGELLWTEIQEDISVNQGRFNTHMGSINPISEALVESGARWLAIEVRGAQESEFTPLAPRLALVQDTQYAPASPSGDMACPHDHLGETWDWGVEPGTGLSLIGYVPWSNALLYVTNHNNGPAIWAKNYGGGNALRGDGYGESIGVYGEGVDGPGIVGRSSSGQGVEGYTTTTNGTVAAVYGENEGSGPGVVGKGLSGRGVEGYTTSTDAWVPAVYGKNEGEGDGIYGLSHKRHGVYGTTTSTSNDDAGVYGKNTNGPAVYAEGDLYVTGAYRGNIGSGGAPYPRPAYDSGWHSIVKGGDKTFNHNLGGNRDNYVVDLQFKGISGDVHNYLYGAMTWAEYLGAWWDGLTTTKIEVHRMSDDEWVDQVRVRIWVYK